MTMYKVTLIVHSFKYLIIASLFALPSMLDAKKAASVKNKTTSLSHNSTKKTANLKKGPQKTVPSRTAKKRAQRLARAEEKPMVTRKTLKEMSLPELREAKEKALEKRQKESALSYLKRMLAICDDKDMLKDIMLELADLLFDMGKLEKAGVMYAEYMMLYPGSDSVEYAEYKGILCWFYRTLGHDRDQTQTEETLKLTDQFLERSDIFTTYASDVKKIKRQCYEKLYDSELSVFEFYLKRGSYNAAQSRLKSMEKRFLKPMPDIRPKLAALDAQVVSTAKAKNIELASALSLDTMKLPTIQTDLGPFDLPLELASSSDKQKKRKKFANRF